MTVDEQIDELDAILSEYFTWKGEAIHLINQTQNYKRMKQAIKKLLLEELNDLHRNIMENPKWRSDTPDQAFAYARVHRIIEERIDQLTKEVNSL